MSWKSFVTAGLLCVIASPVFAVPSVQIVPGGTFANGHLNAAGDWVWNVRLSQTDPPVDVDNGGPLLPGSPLGAELGFRETLSELLSAANLADGYDFDNPGTVIFGWETLTNLGGTGACDSATPGNCPVGVQTNLATDEVFSALGSVDYLSDTDGKGYIQIVIDGPKTSSLMTDLDLLGAYGGGGDQGRIAELNDAFDPGQPTSGTNPYSVRYDTFSGSVSREARAGDVDLNGQVNFDDIQSMLPQFNQPGTWHWYEGDMNGDGDVDFDDIQDSLPNFNTSYTVLTDGTIPGGGSGSGVPEPTAAVLALIAGCLFVGRRNRS